MVAPDPVVIEMKPYVAGLQTIELEIGGRTAPFLVDTAGGINLVTPAVAKAIGCEPFGKLTGFRHNGEAITAPRCLGTSVRAGAWEQQLDEVAVFDLMAMVQGAPEIAGLVGLSLFVDEIVTFDFGGNRIIVETVDSLAARSASMREVEIRPSLQAGGASLDVMLKIEARPGPLWFELDSGNTQSVLVAPHAAEMRGLDLVKGEPGRASLPVAGLGAVEVDALLKEDLIYDGLLNAAFFRDHVVTIDLRSMRMWIGEP